MKISTNDPDEFVNLSFRVDTLSVRLTVEDNYMNASAYVDIQLEPLDKLIAELQAQRGNLTRYI